MHRVRTGDPATGEGIEPAVEGAGTNVHCAPARLAELTLGKPAGPVPDMGGPRTYRVADLLREYLRATHRRRPIEANSDIVSGECPGQQTLVDDPITRPCAVPADRIMGAVADSLRHPYHLPPG